MEVVKNKLKHTEDEQDVQNVCKRIVLFCVCYFITLQLNFGKLSLL